MTFSGTSFFVPTVLGFGVFGVWILVATRMRNLRIHWKYRLGVAIWATLMLVVAISDLMQTHIYASDRHAWWAVILKTSVRIGQIVIGVAAYQLIGRLFPIRMAQCVKEPTPRTIAIYTPPEPVLVR